MDPQKKRSLKLGSLAELGVRTPPPPPVVAPLASHEVRSEMDILVVLYKSVCFVTVSIGEISFSLLRGSRLIMSGVAGLLHP